MSEASGYLIANIIYIAPACIAFIAGVIIFVKLIKKWKRDRKPPIPLLVAFILILCAFIFLCDYFFNTIEYRRSKVDASPIAELNIDQISRFEDIADRLDDFDFLEMLYMLDTSDPDYVSNSYDHGISPYVIPYAIVDGERQYQSGYNLIAKMYKFLWHKGESWLHIEIFIYNDIIPNSMRGSFFSFKNSYSSSAPIDISSENDNETMFVLLKSQRLRGILKDVNADMDRWNTISGIGLGNASIILSEMQSDSQPGNNLSSEFISFLCSLLKNDIF